MPQSICLFLEIQQFHWKAEGNAKTRSLEKLCTFPSDMGWFPFSVKGHAAL